MDEKNRVLNHLLVDLFNNILSIEEKSLKSGPFEDLSISEIHVIDAIGINQTQPMTAIALKHHVTVGTLTISMNNLERKGYVNRKRSEMDRRVVLIQLTEKGKKAFEHHSLFHESMIEFSTSMLSTEEEVVLVNALKQITQYFEKKYQLGD